MRAGRIENGPRPRWRRKRRSPWQRRPGSASSVSHPPRKSRLVVTHPSRISHGQAGTHPSWSCHGPITHQSRISHGPVTHQSRIRLGERKRHSLPRRYPSLCSWHIFLSLSLSLSLSRSPLPPLSLSRAHARTHARTQPRARARTHTHTHRRAGTGGAWSPWTRPGGPTTWPP